MEEISLPKEAWDLLEELLLKESAEDREIKEILDAIVEQRHEE